MNNQTPRKESVPAQVVESIVSTGGPKRTATRHTINDFQIPSPLREVRAGIEKAIIQNPSGIIDIHNLFSQATGKPKQK